MNKAKYQSEALGVIYEDALFDFNHGFIPEERMREYAEGCLVPEVPHVSFSASDVPTRRPSPIAVRSARK